MKQTTRSKGESGEELAKEYLAVRGYQILKSHYRYGRGEIDIIAKNQSNELIFVEVKTATGGEFGNPLSWVHKRKQAQLRKVALGYFQNEGLYDQAARFDVIGITFEEGTPHFQHVEHAFW